MLRILAVEDIPRLRDMVVDYFTARLTGYEVLCASSRDEALLHLASGRPDLLLLDLVLPGSAADPKLDWRNGDEILRRARELYPELPVIVLSTEGKLTRDFLKLREVDDFFQKDLPAAWEREELPIQVMRMIGHLACRSEAMQRLRTQAEALTDHDRLVVITGPTGSGRRHLARTLHLCSRRCRDELQQLLLGGDDIDAIVRALTDGPGVPLLLSGLRRVTTLAQPDQLKLASALRQPADGARFYLTSTVGLDELCAAQVAPELLEALGQARWLQMPGLAERADDLDELAHVFGIEARAEMDEYPRRAEDTPGSTMGDPLAGDIEGEAAELRSLVARSSTACASSAAVDEPDLGDLPVELLTCSGGAISRERMAGEGLEKLQQTSSPQVLMLGTVDGHAPRVTAVEVDRELQAVPDERVGRILYDLASRPGERVALGDRKRRLGLLPTEHIKRYIHMIRKLLDDTMVIGRESEFIASHYGEVYSFKTDRSYTLATDHGAGEKPE